MTIDEILKIAGNFGVPVLILWYLLTKVMASLDRIEKICRAVYRNKFGQEYDHKELVANNGGEQNGNSK